MNIDNNFVIPSCVTIYSARKATRQDVILNFHILHNHNLSNSIRNYIVSVVKKIENCNLFFCMIDENELKGAKERLHFSYAVYYRLLTYKILKGEKCIYLDADVIVNTDLYELYQLELGDSYYGAVPDILMGMHPNQAIKHSEKCKINNYRGYINTGVLLMNLKKLREDNTMSRFSNHIQNYENDYPDQDIINRVCQGKIVNIDWTYNHISYYDDDDYEKMIGPSKRKGRGQIIHYAMNLKPWNDITLRYANIWWGMAKEIIDKEKYTEMYERAFKEGKKYFISEIAKRCYGKQTIVIVGYSDNSKKLVRALYREGFNGKIVYCDNNPQKRKLCLVNDSVLSPEEASRQYIDSIWVIAIQRNKEQVINQIKNLGITDECMLDYYDMGENYAGYLSAEYAQKYIRSRQYYC